MLNRFQIILNRFWHLFWRLFGGGGVEEQRRALEEKRTRVYQDEDSDDDNDDDAEDVFVVVVVVGENARVEHGGRFNRRDCKTRRFD